MAAAKKPTKKKTGKPTFKLVQITMDSHYMDEIIEYAGVRGATGAWCKEAIVKELDRLRK